MVPSEAFNGSYKRNPLNFVNANVSTVHFTMDNKSIPGSALKPNYDTGMYTDCFISMLTTCGKYGVDGGNTIQYSHYPGGYTIYGIDIDNAVNSNYLALPKSANCRLSIQFREALSESVNLIVYAKYPACIKVNSVCGVTV